MVIPRFTSFCPVQIKAYILVSSCRLAVFDLGIALYDMGIDREEVKVVAPVPFEMRVEEGHHIRVHNL
jgi:hypothetical protein